MATDLKIAVSIIQKLQAANIEPLLYGSLGVSQYLGNFKDFGDIDLLVDPVWVNQKWTELRAIMSTLGFTLQDEHEHEFKNEQGIQVAFAENTILIRDGIVTRLSDGVTIRNIGDTPIKTLTAAAFLRAYQFSKKDGYRRDNRGKKDAEIIVLLQKYLQEQDD